MGRSGDSAPGRPSVGFLVTERKSGRDSADGGQGAGRLAPSRDDG